MFLLQGPIYGNLGPLGLAFDVAMVVSGIAVLVRRFYDTERSGWWALAKTVSYAVILSGGSFTGLGTRLGQLPGAVFVVAVALLLGFVFTCFFVFLAS